MKRFAVCMLLLTFCTRISKATAPDGDKPPSSAATTSPTKSVNPNKPTVPAKENDAGITELHQLRELVELQSEEIQDLKCAWPCLKLGQPRLQWHRTRMLRQPAAVQRLQ